MTPRGPLLIAAVSLLLLAPLALATYAPGSQIEADSPVALQGGSASSTPRGLASFVSPDPSVPLTLVLKASELTVNYYSASTTCSTGAPGVPCAPLAPTDRTRYTSTVTLTDASVDLDTVRSAYKLVVTNSKSDALDPTSMGEPGSLVATTPGDAFLGALTKNAYITPYGDDWNEKSPTVPCQCIYQANAQDAHLTSEGGGIHATKGFEVLLQGAIVHFTGKDKDGKDHNDKVDTSARQNYIQYAVLEVANGELVAVSASSLQGFRVDTSDVQGVATFENAKGSVTRDGSTTEYRTEAATLEGPLSITLTKTSIDKSKPDAKPRLSFAVGSNLHVLDNVPDAQPPADQQQPIKLAAAGIGGAAIAGLLAAAVYFWPRLKLASTLLVLPLYSRIERTAVLEHEKRDEIYELIRASPGIHAHEIGEKAHIGWGTTVYHLKLLETHSLVVSKKAGRYKRFFVNTGEYTKKKDVYGALRNETAKRVADFIVNHPGCSQKDLCAALGIQPSLASWHVDKLETVELVKRVKDGRQVRYFAGPAWADMQLGTPPTTEGGDVAAS